MQTKPFYDSRGWPNGSVQKIAENFSAEEIQVNQVFQLERIADALEKIVKILEKKDQ